MTDPNNGSKLVPLPTDDGEKQLPKLSPSDMLRLKNRIQRERKDELRANIKEMGIAADVAVKMLNEFDSRPVDRYDVISYGLLPEGMLEILPMAWLRTYGPVPTDEGEYAEALRKAKGEIDTWRFSLNNAAIAAAGCMNVALKAKAEEKTQEGGSVPLAPSGGNDSPTSTTSEPVAA